MKTSYQGGVCDTGLPSRKVLFFMSRILRAWTLDGRRRFKPWKCVGLGGIFGEVEALGSRENWPKECNWPLLLEFDVACDDGEKEA